MNEFSFFRFWLALLLLPLAVLVGVLLEAVRFVWKCFTFTYRKFRVLDDAFEYGVRINYDGDRPRKVRP